MNAAGRRTYPAEVKRKSARMRAARSRRESPWTQLAVVGTLGWTFILPVVGAAGIARLVVRWTEMPVAGLGVLLGGVALGGYASWRVITRQLDDAARETRAEEEETS
jgi:hypothetical protein